MPDSLPQPETTRVTPPRLRGSARAAAVIGWSLLAVAWLLYLLGFSWASIARADNVLCAPFTSTADLLPYRGACMAVILSSEIAAHLVFFTCALLLITRPSHERMTVLSAVTLLVFSAGASTVTIGLGTLPAYQGLSRALLAAGLWCAILLLLTFPDGRFRPRWTAAIAIGYGLWLLSWFVIPALDVVRGLQVAVFPLFAVVMMPVMAIVWYGYRHHFTPTQQQQTKWVIIGAIGTPVIYLIFSTMAVVATNMLVGTPIGLVVYAATFIGRWIGIMLIPLAIVFSVARLRLWDVDLVIGRALVIGSMTGALAAIFMGALIGVQRIAAAVLDGDGSAVALAAASLAVAALFNPLRVRLRAAIEARYFRGDRPGPLANPDGPTVTLPRMAHEGATEAITQEPVTLTGPSIRPRGYADLIGEQVAGYTVEEVIGHGGMAEVYRARGGGRDVAIKILAPMLARDPLYRARFEREGRTLTDLHHPHIVRVYAAGQEDGLCYIVMEYIAGETLATLITRERALSLERTVPIVRGVAAALAYAHTRGIVHRDVKPSNILLRSGSDGDQALARPVLTDFGIARVEAAQTALTTGSGAIGTLDYIAPEQIVQTSQVDGRADVYSLAIVAYQMLTGRLPFHESNAAALLMSHLQKPAPDPRLYAPSIPPGTANAILRALSKQPDDRYPTPAAFADALA